MFILLLACDPSATVAHPVLQARKDGPVADSSATTTTGATEGAEQDTPLDEDVPAESDRADASGLLGSEKLDADGHRKVFVRRLDGAFTTELVVAEEADGAWTEEVRLFGSAMPDRPAISADGQYIAFTSGVSGLASVWLMPFEGGADPIQLTNVTLHLNKRAPGSPPEGFVPPPIDDSLAFDGDLIEWNGPDGPHAVRWQ